MRVPSVFLLGFGKSRAKMLNENNCAAPCKDDLSLEKLPKIILDLNKDTVSFTASTAKYMKKYATLPDDIKQHLLPKDGMDMLKDMEWVAAGRIKRAKIEDDSSIVYVNPWLKDYYVMVMKPEGDKTCAFYGEKIVADVIWQDKDNPGIHIIKKNYK